MILLGFLGLLVYSFAYLTLRSNYKEAQRINVKAHREPDYRLPTDTQTEVWLVSHVLGWLFAIGAGIESQFLPLFILSLVCGAVEVIWLVRNFQRIAWFLNIRV